MGKSARVLGWEFGRTAREMNALLKEHGYLYGNPGAYGLTEKGQQYAEEQYHSRGTGGYAQYNPSWETRTWSDETAAAIRADMQVNPGGFGVGSSSTKEEEHYRCEPFVDCNGSGDDEDPAPSWKELAIGGAVVGALLIAPHAKPLWNNKVKPAAKRLRDRFAKQEPVESTDS
ncbi:hypothetical protein Sgleb_07790 [Streptomyces glebosus]|uniref:Uncharacterized protein n=1 Tax=Streptomyces glebosus TaxID=249580 RepID=A0A640SPK8_9ACTN|nr:hypothetical protein [Streptomyces glebosus]GFE12732.1 hypothetical protein Sgleb_07790 [Streptomyces glebosus]GHG74893.1 hypothetical protein GCM10010513_49050 [Streptomyces glebosus]